MTPFKLLFFLFCLSFSFAAFSQTTTYKVVCDKTDNKLKVVEASNRSSNLVPIKSGFPFPAIARQWIKDNYPTDDCDAEQIVNDIKNDSEKSNEVQQQNTNKQQQVQQNSVPTNVLPGITTKSKEIEYKNSSFGIDVLMSDMGRYFELDENLVLGMDINFEQLVGKKFYLGSGIHYTSFNSEITSGEETEIPLKLYAFKIPVFIGSRTINKNSYISYEAGISYNTKINSLDSDSDLKGRIAKDNSFDFMLRLKMGGKAVQFEMGTNIWLSDIIEEQQSQKLTTMHMGLRFCF